MGLAASTTARLSPRQQVSPDRASPIAQHFAARAFASAPARPTPTSTSPPSPTTALNPPYAARSGIRVPRSAPTPRRPLLLHTPRRSFCPQAFRSARARALLLVTRLCSVARIPAFCPLAPHTPTGRILGRESSLLLFAPKASPGPTTAGALAVKLSAFHRSLPRTQTLARLTSAQVAPWRLPSARTTLVWPAPRTPPALSQAPALRSRRCQPLVSCCPHALSPCVGS
jgi:hypothetical protein